MKTNERCTDKWGRVLRSAERRREMVAAFRNSGQTQAAFCRERGLNATTFSGWLHRAATAPTPAFAQIEMPVSPQEAVEVWLPNGVRIVIRHPGQRDELVALIRGVCGCTGGVEC
jgi:hypothetical protein